MSKIYEALRQAELDRTRQVGPEPAHETTAVAVEPLYVPLAPQPVTSTVVPQALRHNVASILPAAEPIPVPAEQIDELAGAPTETPALDLTGVAMHPWAPSADQLPALQERGSAVEQFRSLRSRLQEFRDLNRLKAVLVSSGLPQEGKSFVAVNLALALARHKSTRVLLIDGDMRRSTLHKHLGTTQGPGLTEYLSGAAALSEVMQRPDIDDPEHPLPPGMASLTFIPGGFEHSKAADLSGNHKFDRLIESVSPFFDWIIVDSSPVNLVTDGVNLARACDAVLLVARGGVTRYETAQRALAELKSVKVLGFVLNAVSAEVATGSYYGYDGYDPYAPHPDQAALDAATGEPAGTTTK